ncbi:MAG: hydroxymethylglutaryl-CoA synthase [Longimonas sp.]|uniref:hydroxymethylglutaryl-CoA synthase n=1 Tax=Longimonas sp. TaxID=2039626 RepID=UPI00335651E6
MASVGIDAMEIWTGKLVLDLPNTFAPVKDEAPAKYTKGLGLTGSSLPDVYEDIVTMGANACKRLIERKGLTLNDIGRIDVATESSFDRSKPVSTYIAGCLEQVFEGDLSHANKGERKFACLSGTQAVDDACNWIRAKRHRGRGALVVVTDTALYERDDPGEATQGAGAVALYITETPSIVALSTEQGIGSKDETDFLKPNQQFPSVDGRRSIGVYLDRVREALHDYESVAGRIHKADVSYLPFHTPFPGMVRKAALMTYRHLIAGTDEEETLLGLVGEPPSPDAFDDADAYKKARYDYQKAIRNTEPFQTWYTATVAPTLSLSRRTGNWYTGSVHVARASALLEAARHDNDLVGKRMLVGSYGSGAQAEVHAETVCTGWRAEIEALTIEDQLDARYDLSFEAYEQIHSAHTYGTETSIDPFTTPKNEFAFDGWGDMGERTYAYVSA